MNPLAKLKTLEQELKDSRAHAAELGREIASLKSAQTRIDHSKPIPRRGIDCTGLGGTLLEHLRSSGISFVGRYLTGPYALSGNEARRICDTGTELFAIFESTADRMAEGGTAGALDAATAFHALDSLDPTGMPPVYFACDYDASDFAPIINYLRGVAKVVPFDRIGVYGGYDTVKAIVDANAAKYLFQTIAWSGGKWFPEAQLRQEIVEITLWGTAVDLDTAMATDFGQFKV